MTVLPNNAPLRVPAVRPLPENTRHLTVLNEVRMAALHCRSARRSDLFEACALLSNMPQCNRAAFATALIKGLHDALPNPPVFLRPGVAERSFDEAWLVAVLSAYEDENWDSLVFLLRSRLKKHHQRVLGFLMQGLLRDAEAI